MAWRRVRPNGPGVLYPFALAVFPALSLAVGNRGENIRASDLLLPLAICLWMVLVAWVASRAVSRDPHRRALIALAIAGWFACYGLFASVLGALGLGSTPMRDEYALPLSLALLLVACRMITKWRGSLEGASRFLNKVALLLFLFLPIRYLSASGAATTSWKPSIPDAVVPQAASAPLPDTYYIVLDAYTGSRALAKNYGYDNSSFESSLRSRGFYVPRNSRSNYSTTFLALAAALNWQYLDWLPKQIGENSRDRTLPYHMIEDSRSARFLKALGYRVVFFPTAYGATAHNRFADELIPGGASDQPAVQTEFQAVWLASTALRPLLRLGCVVSDCESSPFPFRPEPPELILWKLSRLAELPTTSPGPKFVFAHLLIPHEPYVFGQDCSPKPLDWPSHIGPEEDRRMRLAYIEQVRCVNRQVLLLVERLQEDSEQPPIIIFQADHGNARFPFGRPPDLEDISSEQLEERTTIFGAYYLPEVQSEFYDSITPVNVMPAVFRAYFGADIPRLPDRTFYSSWERPYRFTEIP